MKSTEKTARSLFLWLGALGILLSALGFLLYISNLMPTTLSPAESAAMWDRSAEEFQGTAEGVFDSFVISSLALAFLATAPLPILLIMALSWFRRRDFLYGFIALAISALILVAMLR